MLDIRDQCIDRNVSFFFKQWGGVHKKKNGRLLEGRTWDEYPGIRSETKDSPNTSIYEYLDCLTPAEKSMLLMRVPEAQLAQLFRDATLS